jgi:hypothetical protein
LNLSPPHYFLFLQLKIILKERYASNEEIIGKAMTVLTEVSKKWLQECFQKLYEHWKVCHCLRKFLWRKCCVIRCNRFQYLLKLPVYCIRFGITFHKSLLTF